ncbi:hypothetical protein HPB50_022511 [Hyalomma asiaticum]|uniref:Uncharacterized protein n=1 Tax=Hyalomma asiaticum TaxID=266040 RepID=A0ACB7SB50_HYAAI|nr:hypothetical protein HPB50_022511 [Hyalomma asiaticum]
MRTVSRKSSVQPRRVRWSVGEPVLGGRSRGQAQLRQRGGSALPLQVAGEADVGQAAAAVAVTATSCPVGSLVPARDKDAPRGDPPSFLFLLVILALANGVHADSATEREPASFRQQQPLASYPTVYGLAYQQGFPTAYLARPVARPSLGSRLRGLVNALFFRRQQQQPGFQAYKPAAAVKPDLVAAASKPLLHSAHKIHFPGSFQTDKIGYGKQGLQAAYAQAYPYLSTAKLYNGLYGASKNTYASKPFAGAYKA